MKATFSGLANELRTNGYSLYDQSMVMSVSQSLFEKRFPEENFTLAYEEFIRNNPFTAPANARSGNDEPYYEVDLVSMGMPKVAEQIIVEVTQLGLGIENDAMRSLIDSKIDELTATNQTSDVAIALNYLITLKAVSDFAMENADLAGVTTESGRAALSCSATVLTTTILGAVVGGAVGCAIGGPLGCFAGAKTGAKGAMLLGAILGGGFGAIVGYSGGCAKMWDPNEPTSTWLPDLGANLRINTSYGHITVRGHF